MSFYSTKSIRLLAILFLLFGHSARADEENVVEPVPADPVLTPDTPRLRQGWQEFCRRGMETKDRVSSSVAGRMEAGLRVAHVTILNDKDDFFGSIDHLDTQQNYAPTHWFVDWFLTSEHGIELSWDSFRASTTTTKDGHVDGDIVAAGPTIAYFRRYPITVQQGGRTFFLLPSAGAGLSFMGVDFDHEGWYHHGFPLRGDGTESKAEYEAWRDAGSPAWPNGGYQREFVMDKAVGLVLIARCAVVLWGPVSAEVFARYMNVTVRGDYVLSYHGNVTRERAAEFPISNIACGGGIKCSF